MSLVSSWLWASLGFIIGWVAQLFWGARVRVRPYEEEFVCYDCGRHVYRITGGFEPSNTKRPVCLDCEMMPGWFLDSFLARALDPEHQAQPRPDYVKGT